MNHPARMSPAGADGPCDFLRLYRVLDWLHFLPLPLAGWLAGDARSACTLVGSLVGWAFALAYMSAINQAFDDQLDRHAGKNPVGARFHRREAIVLSLPPAVAAVLVVAWLAPAGLPPMLLLLGAATVYSAPPRLKRVPVVGTLWNILIALPALFLADRASLDRPSLRVLVGLFALLLLVSQLIHEAEDREDDRAGGVSTLAVLMGARGALGAAALGLAALPTVTFSLAEGLSRRVLLVAGTALFSAGWLTALAALVRRGDLTGLRAVRLWYRYAALVLGALAFLATSR